MRRFIIVSLIVLSALAGVLSTPTAFAAPKSATADQPFWVTGSTGSIVGASSVAAYQQSAYTPYKLPVDYQSMTQTRYYWVRGQYSSDGRWHYRLTVHMAVGVLAEWVDVGQNATAHTELIAVGIEPSSDIHPLTSTSVANLASVVYDPVNLQLIQIFDYLTYTWNGTCVTGINAHFPQTILYPDGWVTIGETPSAGHGCGGGYALTQGLYANPIFCAGNNTSVSISTQSEGLYNGSRYASFDHAASGICSGLLHYGDHWN